jgi:hypothetical protein
MGISPAGYQASLYYGNAVFGSGASDGTAGRNDPAGGGDSKDTANTVTGTAGNSSKNTDKVTISGAKGKEKDQKTQQEVQKLKEREQHVISHELAHQSAGGRYAGAPTYTYTKGPDGKSYITGGEVSIDVSKAKDPEETVTKMRQVRASALAPSDPSPQDESVAQKASQIEVQAQQEIAQQKFAGSDGKTSSDSNPTGTKPAGAVQAGTKPSEPS